MLCAMGTFHWIYLSDRTFARVHSLVRYAANTAKSSDEIKVFNQRRPQDAFAQNACSSYVVYETVFAFRFISECVFEVRMQEWETNRCLCRYITGMEAGE